MNINEYLILLKDQDETQSVQSARYCTDEKKWIVYFARNLQPYRYSKFSVKMLSNPQKINLINVRFEYKGKPFYKLKYVLKFDTYYRFFYESGNSIVHHESEITIQNSCLIGKNSNQYMSYFTELSKAISIKTENGISLLGSQYEKLNFIGENTVLASYFNVERYPLKKYPECPVIFPFGCNESQKKAVNMVLRNQVSVIKGPPGTGKTQTILNLIANLLIQNKTLAVISNNNSAIENVKDKLEKYNFAYLCAMLGSQENKSKFIQEQELHNFEKTNSTLSEWKELLSLADNKQKEIQECLKMNNRLAELEMMQNALVLEQKHFINYLEETFLNKKKVELKNRLSSTQILGLKVSLEEHADKNKKQKLTWIQKLQYYIQFRIRSRDFLDCSLDEILTEFERLYYICKLDEIEKEKIDIKIKLDNFNYDKKQEELGEISIQVLKEKISQTYDNYKDKYFEEEDLWKNSKEFIFRYPVILSTTHSIRRSLPNVEYDYIIVDEASQVDLLTGVLAMSCTKNMVIVGDNKQLPNVVTNKTKQAVAAIEMGYVLPEGMGYADYSLLTSVQKILTDAPCIILREHYRCHPRIIEFCNKKFYENQLIIMTEDKNEEDVLKVYKTVLGNHARKRINQRQIDEIKQEVLPELLRSQLQESDIGIISPYRDQVEEMEEDLEQKLCIDTVHKFQGREKDAIIITTVDNEITEFADNPNLLNVAVSRAVNKLRLIISDNEYNENTNIGDLVRYIMYEKGEVVEGKVYSVFDLLYKEYKEVRDQYLRNRKRISEVDSENLFFYFIKEVIKHEEMVDLEVAVHVPVRMLIKDVEGFTEEETRYALNRGTHVDFLLYKTVDKSPIIAIEVDGHYYHRKGTKQREVRDKLKNSIFGKVGLELLRFETTGSREDVKLRTALQKYK